MNDLEQYLTISVQRPKFLLCRPEGGLNDMLNQIEKCWRYAERNNRILVIDTKLSPFGTYVSRFFQKRRKNKSIIFRPTSNLIGHLGQLSCFPRSVEGQIDSYGLKFSVEKKNYVEPNSQDKITFDFSRTYQEPLIVHHQCGGGHLSNFFWKKVTFSNQIKNAIVKNQQRITESAESYAAIHIRNTDYKTDYRKFFEYCATETPYDKIVVCSDSAEVLDYVKAQSNGRVIFSSPIPDLDNRPLHSLYTFSSGDQLAAQMQNSIVDLVALSGAAQLFYTDTTGGFPSGFSRMAEFLVENKSVLAGMTGMAHRLIGFDGVRSGQAIYVSSPVRRIGWGVKKKFCSFIGQY